MSVEPRGVTCNYFKLVVVDGNRWQETFTYSVGKSINDVMGLTGFICLHVVCV